MTSTETIFALSSGHGRAGVAVIRGSGPQAKTIAESLSGACPVPRMATVAKLKNPQGDLLDEALLIYFSAPNSFTGEDVLEIHTHGSPAVVKAVLGALAQIPDCHAR